MKPLTHSKRSLYIGIFLFLVIVGLWNVWKPLPKEINTAWGVHAVTDSDVTFLTDTTYTKKDGSRIYEQHIFDEVMSMIDNASSYIFIDLFLWNDFGAQGGAVHRTLSKELAEKIIAKKKSNPSMVIQVVTDPINTVYGGQPSILFSDMEKSGIVVTYTNLPSLRDSNPILSSVWRVFIYPVDLLHKNVTGSLYTFRIFPNILNSGGEKVTLRAYFSLLNFKANHRKLIVVDEMVNGTATLTGLIASANPHDGSSAHSNVALKIRGSTVSDLLLSEASVVAMAKGTFSPTTVLPKEVQGNIQAQIVTDRAILDTAVSLIQSTSQGDTIDILMFYLSERHIIKELLEASKRGVTIRIILDPNKDAFGKQKNGIPNREVADSLVKKSDDTIKVRWCDTHGEQCHGKLLIVKHADERTMMLGSANYTRRNIGGYNLETNIVLTSNSTYNAWSEASVYFDGLWNNKEGIFSTAYEAYKDESVVKKVIAWIMENTGLGTF